MIGSRARLATAGPASARPAARACAPIVLVVLGARACALTVLVVFGARAWALIVLVVFGAGVDSAFAASAARADDSSLARACQLDFQLFCADVDPESPRDEVVACLRPHLSTLTESCRAVLDPSTVPRAVGRPPPDPFGACRDDFRRLCPKARDRMEAARCVHRHLASLSPACRDAMASRPGIGGTPGSASGAGASGPAPP